MCLECNTLKSHKHQTSCLHTSPLTYASSVCSWWDHLHPPTTTESATRGKILQCIKVGCSLFIFIWSERWWNCCLYYPPPVPALRCLQFVGYWKISPTTEKKIREELMVFLCHYRNKLIFGGGGDSLELEQHDVSGDVSRGMAQWQANSARGMPVHWISQLMFTMLQEMKKQSNTEAAGCTRDGTAWALLGHGRACRGRGQLWHCLGETLTKWEGHLGSSCLWSSSSTMRVAFLALRLMCLAWLWPVTQLNSSHFPNKRRHKEVYVGENTRPKHGGWATVGFLVWVLDFL